MTRMRTAFAALLLGVVVGARARARGSAAAAPSPALTSLQVRRELSSVEERLTGTVERLDRERRRASALVLAIAVLIVVPAVLVASRPDIPDVVVAAVLAVDLVVAAGALLYAARAGRSRRGR
jgi:hypothetical protein